MSRTIFLFGITSLFADIAGEMIFPILPAYFAVELGISVAALGIIEGVSDGLANFLQVGIGWMSDRLQKRKIFVVSGYSIAAAGKCILALAHGSVLAFVARIFDRGGKGVRTTPRDALLVESIRRENRGVAFGFHRMMDSAGGILGNILAIVLIAIGFSHRNIVWISLVPAIIAVLPLLPVRDVRRSGDMAGVPLRFPSLRDFTVDSAKFGSDFWKFISVSVLFSFAKLGYVFLLLRLTAFGVAPEMTPVFYLVFNIVQTAFSLPAGKFGDVFNRSLLVFCGFVLFAFVCIGLVFGGNTLFLFGIFSLYGVSYACLEVGLRSRIVDIVPQNLKATGLGMYYTLTGIAVMAGGGVAGFLWTQENGKVTFTVMASIAGVAAVLFGIFFRKNIVKFSREA